MEAEPYISALGQALGMELTLSDAGNVSLSMGRRNLFIQWVESIRSFVLYAEVGPLGGWRSGEVCRQLLTANFLLVDTQGAAFSYNDATGMVGLNYSVPVYGLETDGFLLCVENIVALADEWRSRLEVLNRAQEEQVKLAQDAVLQDDTLQTSGFDTQFLRV